MRSKLIIILLLLLSPKYSWAQTTIFSENMGTPSGTSTIAANSFQNNGSLTYSNGAQTSSADVRSTSASSSYTGASGGGNVYFTTTSGAYGFSVEGINTSNYNTLSLQFGYKKESASTHAAFSVDYWNGTSWITLANSSTALFNELANASAVWYLSKVLTLPTDAQINGLKIRFVKTGTTAIRIDDVKLTGIDTPPTITNFTPASITNNSATFGGNVTATGGSPIIATGTVYAPTATNSNPVFGGSGVINLATSSPISGTGSFSNDSGTVLSPNVQYSYNAYASKSTGLKGYGTVGTFYTLALTPSTPTVNSPSGNSLNVTIGSDGNPSNTIYAILETTTNKYVHADGTLASGALYNTAANWGTKTVIGLSSNATYTFQVIAKSGGEMLTAPSTSASGTTSNLPSITTLGTLSALNATYGTASSYTSFSFIAGNLTDDVVITAPFGFEISKTTGGNSGYADSQTISPISGNVSPTTIYVRLAAGTPYGTYSGNLTLVSYQDILTVNIATANSEIAKLEVAISGISALNKTYDGTTTASWGGTPVLNGILPDDAEYVVLDTTTVTANFADAAIGTGKPVTVMGYSLEGSAADNYNLTQPTGLAADITANKSSNVVLNTSSSTSSNQNMDYLNYQGSSLSSTTNSNGVMGFRVRDGGASANDADNLGTELTAITFTVTNAANLRSARIFVGNSAKGSALVVPTPDANGVSTLTFSGLTGIVAPDNGDLAVHLRVTFNSVVTDNQQMQFKIVSVTAKSDGSLFASANGGGATSPTTGNINRIIVEADRLAFAIQPNDTYVGSIMNPAPSVGAVDALGNTDLDYSGTISMTSSGTMLNSPRTASVINGTGTFYSVVHTATGTEFVLNATSPGLTSTTSAGTFSIDSNNPNDPNDPNDPTPGGDPNPGGISSTPSYHDTQGKLDISNSGQAVYTLPVALPPSISSVGPTINLAYSSGQNGGIAGQGWSINSISYISRVAARPDIDGFKDGVDFDDNDKLALDGQRLLVKSGSTYWSDGSLYETEVQSNSKIQLMGTGSNIYFIVTSPDGSRSWYGNYGGMNATDLSAYYIVRYEDANGNFILYNYGKPLNKTLCIDTIQFSANTISNSTPLNYIKFNYTSAARTESAYFKGILIEKAELLNKVKVYTNGNLFKEYRLNHTADSQLGYQRVTKIQEFNGAGEAANPVAFEYNSTGDLVNETTAIYTDSYAASDAPQLTGDFDGDGRMDIVASNKMYLKTFLSTPTSPVTLPSMSGRKIAATIVKDNKLNQSQTIIDPTMNIDSIVFKYFGYNQGTNAVVQENTKTIAMDNSAPCSNPCAGSPYADANLCNNSKKTAVNYIEGDFNGDGISEVIVARYDESYEYGIDPDHCISLDPESGGGVTCLCTLIHHPISNIPSEVLMVNLDTNASTTIGSPGVAVLSGLGITRSSNDKTMVGDYNSDGKSDILVVKSDKTYVVYSFNQLNVAPWVAVEVIGQGVFDNYAADKPFLLGDYNGDGKPDIMIPEVDGECVPKPGYSFVNTSGVTIVVPAVVCPNSNLWHIYYSNPNPTGGIFFTKKPYLITDYIKKNGDDFYSYYPLDINKDGKTDLIRVSVGLYNPGGFFDPTDVDSRWRISTFVNNIGNNAGGATDFIYNYQSPNGHNSDDNGFPIPIVADIKYKGLSSDMLMIRYHSSNNFTRKITYIDFTKNVNIDNSLKKVNQSNGAIVDEITYDPMQSSEANAGFGTPSDFYSSNNSVNYPALELKQIPTNKLVSKLTNTTLGAMKFQDFRYNGYLVQLDGIGSIGFKKIARTAWYNTTSDKKTWTVTEIDPLQRGSSKFMYTLKPSTATFSFPANLSTGLMSKTENSFTASAPGVFPYTILLQNQKSTDYITGIVKETVYNTYDTYNLPTSVTDNNYTGTTLQGTTTTITDYDTPSFGTGSTYFIGRPHKITTTSTAYGNTKKSYQTISYLNGNVSEIDKNVYQPDGSTLDPVTLVEKMTYYPNGLLMDKEVSATGTTAGINDVTPRKISYTYDPTNRFVSTATDPELLVSTNMSFHPLYGSVLVAKNPFNQTTTNVYDNWGKPISVTDNAVNLRTNYSYNRTNNIYTTTVTRTTAGGVSDGSSSIVDQDVLAREIRKGSKSINGTWTYVSTEYDAYGRKYRTSEPYFGSGSPSQWTSYAYDDYSRPTITTSFTGKVVNTTYHNLIVTVADSVMSKSKTIDSNGQTTSTTDIPGGTINYKYDANGNLLESDYDGIKTTMVYDNWGRKTELVDTSSGTYTYSYNAYGEIKTEGTPKGLSTYTYDGLSGRLLTKSIQGLTTADATDILSTYNFNATTKLLDSMTVTNPNDGGSTFAYTYDTQRRLYKTDETQTLLPSGTAVFTKQLAFDNFSRVDTETRTATAFGKSSTKTIKHSYSSNNGAEIQIKDNTTSVNIWQANTTDARGNILTAALGNGINVINTFDQYGYASQFQHKLGTAEVMTLNTTFDPILGNLSSRYNSMFDMQENFTYDALDRLTAWDGSPTNLMTLPFNTTTDGFTFSGTSTQGAVSNVTGKLKVTLKSASVYAGRNLNIIAAPGDKVHVRGDISNKTVFNGTTAKLLLVETDVNDNSNFIEFPIVTIANGTFDLDYIVSDNFESANLSLKFIIEQGTYCPTCPNYWLDDGEPGGAPITEAATFYLDNLKIDKIAVNRQDYDDRGRITSNNVGEYHYDGSHPYQNNSISMTPDALAYYTGRPQQDVTYNAFKAPVTIEEQGIDLLSFGYNAFGQRSVMYYGNNSTDKLTKPYRKYYSADGSMEIKATFSPGNTSTPAVVEFMTYIGGDAYSAPALVKSDGTTQNYFYLHRDYQGSILAITDATGVVVEKRLFDPWGEVINIQDGAGNPLAQLTFFDRGYTGHEHLQSVGLINMNARLYDPKLHRFLEADNYVQDPYNTQNYNRYGYCVNNPLKYTDLTGNVFNIATLAGCIPVVGSIFSSLLMHQSIDWDRVAVDVVVTGISAAVTFGIGSACAGISNFFTKAAVSALAHGVFQGGLSAATGGKFWAGFAAGALSSIACSVWQGGTNTTINSETGLREGIAGTGMKGIGGKFAGSVVGTLSFGAVMGGAGSAIGGGNFWKGAVTGLIVAGFNDMMHKIKQNMSFKEQLESKGINPKGKFGFTSGEFIDNINAVEELHSEFQQAASKLGGLEVAESIYNEYGQEASGATVMNPDGKYTISLSSSRVKTNLDFVYTYGAELSHVNYNCNMDFQTWSSQTRMQRYQEEYSVHYNWNFKYGAPDGVGQVKYWYNQLNK